MNADSPGITVLMPVFNAGSFLRPAVDSVLTQTRTDFELLIIDDGSTDGAMAALNGLADPRLRLLENPRNLGLVATLNRGVELARGHFLARMDADDLCHPERLACQAAWLESHPDVGICSTWAEFINEQGRGMGILQTPIGRDLPTFFWRPSPLVHAAMMARTELLRQHPYDRAFADAEDYELWLRLYDQTRFHNLARPLYRIRRHGGSVSVVSRERQLRNSHLALQKFLGHDRLDYPAFLALLAIDCRLPPWQWLQAYRLVSRRTGWIWPRLARESRNYLKLWRRHARTSR